MEICKSKTMAISEAREILQGKTLVVGAKQLRKSLQKGIALQVLLAKNADPAITEPIAALSQQNNVPVAWVASMAELGNLCGIEVGAAAAAAIQNS